MGRVSRETPAAPPEARQVFEASALRQAERYAELLATAGVLRGVIGPRETPRLWERHLLNSAVLADLVPQRASVADIGSGAGLPGLVLAIARPDLRVTLVEPLLRRTGFLDEVVGELGLGDRVEVLRARAEELHGRRTFRVVTARAVAPLERLARWCLPLVDPAGELIALKGITAGTEVVEAMPALRSLGCDAPVVVELGAGVLSEPTWAVRLARPETGPVGWRARPARDARRTTRRTRQQRRPA